MAKTLLIDIRNNSFPPTTVEEGTYVVWRNLDPYAHSAETLRNSPEYFNAGPLLPGEVSSPVFFARVGRVEYLCRYHAGMSGTVTVVARGSGTGSQPALGHAHGGGHGAHLQHFHGFVTGGRTAQRLFMTHTPLLADERHHYQVILQGSLPDKAHAAAYEALRKSAYGDGKVQVFHDHLALPDIGSGEIKEFPHASLEYYPNDPDGVLGGTEVPGLKENVQVRIDKVIHFHRFETDSDYPEALTYVVYGDADDLFIDHFINRAPSFHSVAKLKARPAFYTDDCLGTAVKVSVPSKRILDVSPKLLRRVAFVDNSFHLFWLPPAGTYIRPLESLDPLRKRDGSAPAYDVVVEGGGKGQIEIGRFLHFDVRLLNYGVFIT